MKLLQEFKEFAMKGNVVDMAIGVIIGGAFGKIVTSLVNDLLMPLIGALIGNVDFTTLSVTLREAVMNGEEVVKEAVTLRYGNFIQTTVDFLIVAFCIFMVIKLINKATNMVKKQEKEEQAAPAEEPAPAPEPSQETVLLTEIRDLLKNQAK
ncbi:MAG: large-conductance mechanosensitive channel protein MscL [Bacteroidales bacterium]|nr:large-conductance mechanosensitive channel protein MscL [Bacteroidales bacterium]